MQTREENRFKIVLLGDSGTGKTSILNRQLHGFSNLNHNATIGCHCSDLTFNLDGRQVILQVWDTAVFV